MDRPRRTCGDRVKENVLIVTYDEINSKSEQRDKSLTLDPVCIFFFNKYLMCKTDRY